MTPECAVREKRILLVEDDYPIARAMSRELAALGAEVVGPAATVQDALRLIEAAEFDAAVLDINVRGEQVYPVADALMARGIRFVFATGYDSGIVSSRYSAILCFEKPLDCAQLIAALFGAVGS